VPVLQRAMYNAESLDLDDPLLRVCSLLWAMAGRTQMADGSGGDSDLSHQ